MDIKVLTTAYLYLLAHTEIAPMEFEKISTMLTEKINSCSRDSSGQAPVDFVKSVLVDRLAGIEGVDRIFIFNGHGYRFETVGRRINGVGPATVLIIPMEEEKIECPY